MDVIYHVNRIATDIYHNYFDVKLWLMQVRLVLLLLQSYFR